MEIIEIDLSEKKKDDIVRIKFPGHEAYFRGPVEQLEEVIDRGMLEE